MRWGGFDQQCSFISTCIVRGQNIPTKEPEFLPAGILSVRGKKMVTHNNFNAEMLRSVFDSLPSLVFVVDEDVRIQEYNAVAAGIMPGEQAAIIKHRGGDVMHCIHSTEVPEGCGRAPYCKDCVIRNSVNEAFQGSRAVRRRTKLEIIKDKKHLEIYALITASPFTYDDRQLALLVIEDISEIAELRRMIPICSVCRKLRDDEDSWSRVETYFKKQWDVDFSHAICPDCYKIEVAKIEGNSRKFV
ncbi:MAG TPA: hypothetical protein DET40_11680 [Lentisphaeria bacterium]|nr:hypothetical protein [Lentisphaeria bacterium]